MPILTVSSYRFSHFFFLFKIHHPIDILTVLQNYTYFSGDVKKYKPHYSSYHQDSFPGTWNAKQPASSESGVGFPGISNRQVKDFNKTEPFSISRSQSQCLEQPQSIENPLSQSSGVRVSVVESEEQLGKKDEIEQGSSNLLFKLHHDEYGSDSACKQHQLEPKIEPIELMTSTSTHQHHHLQPTTTQVNPSREPLHIIYQKPPSHRFVSGDPPPQGAYFVVPYKTPDIPALTNKSPKSVVLEYCQVSMWGFFYCLFAVHFE